VPKIISKRCELVKLCHINRGGPVNLCINKCSEMSTKQAYC